MGVIPCHDDPTIPTQQQSPRVSGEEEEEEGGSSSMIMPEICNVIADDPEIWQSKFEVKS